jgi:DNA-binding NarL/FixJ family response regulator
MQIERCVVLIPTQSPGLRIDHREVDVVRKMAVSLPMVSCLKKPLPGDIRRYYQPDELEPVEVVEAAPEPRLLRPEYFKPLSPREKRVQEMLKEGMSLEAIARDLKTSPKVIRGYNYSAQKKILTQAQQAAEMAAQAS